MTRQDQQTLSRIRQTIAGYLETKPPEPLETEGYKFPQWELPPEHKKVPISIRVPLATYHRIAEVMCRNRCGLSDAVNAMLENVEAYKVAPLDFKWKNKYSTKGKKLWQSFDLYKVAGLRKRRKQPTPNTP